jgi:uncharacterized membrane protein (UPF0127 family)
MNTLIVFVVVGAAGLLIVGVVLYFYPGIVIIMPSGQESQLQQTIPQEEISSGKDTYQQVYVTLNDQILIADISATDEQRISGLTGKDTLAENEAMLFVFENEAEHIFWMKDMKFPIDIIWIDSDKSVVDIEHNLPPCNAWLLCTTYMPDGDSLYVLETVGGFAQKYGIVKGTPVEFELNSQNIS